jgi:mono/diheme cytochrome c family protein
LGNELWSPLKTMNALNERQAFWLALLVSCTALAATLGASLLVRPAQFSWLLPAKTATTRQRTADAAQGRHLFLMNCAHCHADDAHGDEGPDLHNLHKSDGRIHQVISAGIKGEMPSFGKKFGEPEIRELTAYLRTLRN